MSQEFLILSETADGKKLINQSSVHVTRLWSCTQVYLFQGCSKFWAAFQVVSHSWESMTAWSWSTRQGCCKYSAATNQTSAILRKCVFDVTSVGQRFSPRAFNSVKAEVKFHLECKLRFSCVQALLWQMHWSNSAAPSVEFLCQVVTFYLHEDQPH